MHNAQTEGVRGSRQYGQVVPISELPCSALGARVDLEAMRGEAGFMMPTDTFSGKASFTVGEEVFELVEAHGETHDQLFVWLPRQKLLMPGDNFYNAFPNLYTIRGTTPRPIRSWIQSLDDMRKLQPEFLVPSHTQPVIGKEMVAEQLTAYRDGITWVYVETIRVRPSFACLCAGRPAVSNHLPLSSLLPPLYPKHTRTHARGPTRGRAWMRSPPRWASPRISGITPPSTSSTARSIGEKERRLAPHCARSIPVAHSMCVHQRIVSFRSVKAIYSGELGWFDGQAEDLYPMPYDEESTKTLLLMGGASKVLKAVEDAQAMNDHKWALKLIKIIRGAQAKDKSGTCGHAIILSLRT